MKNKIGKRGFFPTIIYETLIKVIIALFFILAFAILFVSLYFIIFAEEDTNYGALKSYETLVSKIESLENCEDCSIEHLMYFSYEDDIVFFGEGGIFSWRNGNIPRTFECEANTAFEKPKSCKGDTCICFNTECQTIPSTMTLGYIEYIKNYENYLIETDQIQNGVKVTYIYLNGGIIPITVPLPVYFRGLNPDFCASENEAITGDPYKGYFNILIEKNNNILTLSFDKKTIPNMIDYEEKPVFKVKNVVN